MSKTGVVTDLIRKNLSAIETVAKNAQTYFTGSIDRYSVVRWILQWDDPRSVEMAIKLLTNLHFIDPRKLDALMQKAWNQIPAAQKKNAVLTGLGNSFDSAAIVAYGFTKSSGFDEKEIASRWREPSALAKSVADNGRAIIMLDDNITSGTQLKRIFDEMLPDYTGDREHFKKALNPTQIVSLKKQSIYVTVAVQLGDAREALVHVQKLGFKVKLVCGELDGKQWFDYGNAIWSTPEDAIFIRDRVSDISRQILSQKGWDEPTLANRLLGYGNNPKLTAFWYNIPKSLPAPFWKYGQVSGKSWIPLFPERAECEKFGSEIRNANGPGDALWEQSRTIVDSATNQAPQPAAAKPKVKPKFAVYGAVPNAPPHYFQRKTVLSKVSKTLVANDGKSAVGLHGIGGAGKTVTAAALTRDSDVQKAFPSGIFWLTFGEQPNLLSLLNQLAAWVPECGGRPFTAEAEAQTAIRSALHGKRALIIVNDVWTLEHASALNLVSDFGRLLITTRNRAILTGVDAQEFLVDVVDPEDALSILASWAGSEKRLLPTKASDVAKECGRLPLALSMIGALVRLGPTTWADALALLKERKLDDFQRFFPDYPYPNLLRSIACSVDQLEHEDRERYLDLSVFPEDRIILEGPLQVLWQLSRAQTGACMGRLASRSLATLHDLNGVSGIVLHDLQLNYINKIRAKDLKSLHSRLVDAYAAKCANGGAKTPKKRPHNWHDGPDDGYFFQNLLSHLLAAGRSTEATDLLLNLNWLEAKSKLGFAFGLLDDFSKVSAVSAAHPRNHLIPLIEEALRRDVHFISRHANDYPQALFQCLWNSGWWYDATGAEEYYGAKPMEWSRGTNRFSTWLEECRALKEKEHPGFMWMRSLRPPQIRLGASPSKVLRGSENAVMSVAFSPDQKRLASVSNGMLRLWDTHTGAEVGFLPFSNWPCGSVLYCGSDRLLVAGNLEVKVISANDLKQIDAIRFKKGFVFGLSLSANSKRLAAARNDGVTVFDLSSGLPGKQLFNVNPEPLGPAIGLLSPDGSRVAVQDKGGIVIWDVAKKKKIAQFSDHFVHCAAFCPTGSKIAIGGNSGINVFDVASGNKLFELRGSKQTVTAIVFSPVGERLVAGSEDGSIRLWDLSNGAEIRCFFGHSDEVTGLTLSSDSKWMASGAQDATIQLWDMSASKHQAWKRKDDQEDFASCVFATSGSNLLVGNYDSQISLWETATGKLLHRKFQDGTPHTTIINFSPDGSQIVGADGYGRAFIWKAVNGKKLLSLAVGAHMIPSLRYSPDGTEILGVTLDDSYEGSVVVWDVRTGAIRFTIKNVGNAADAVWSTDLKSVVVLLQDGTVKVFDRKTGNLKRRFKSRPYGYRFAFRTNGKILAIAGRDGVLSTWHFGEGKLLKEYEGYIDVDGYARGCRCSAIDFGADVLIFDWDNGKPVAWCPGPGRDFVAHPKCQIWAGSEGRLLRIVQLEGKLPASDRQAKMQKVLQRVFGGDA